MALKDLFFRNGDNAESVKGNIDEILKELPQSTSIEEKEFENPIQLDGIKTIENIFVNHNLNNQNIYEIVAFIESLPQGMDIVAKKTSLKSILKAAKYKIEEMILNAESRIEILKEYSEKDKLISKNMINDMNEDIVNKLKEIEDLKQKISEEENRNKQQIKLTDEEVNRIVELKNYIV